VKLVRLVDFVIKKQCNTVHALRPGGSCWFLTRDTTVQFLGSIKRGTYLYLLLSVQIPIPTNIQPIFQLVHVLWWHSWLRQNEAAHFSWNVTGSIPNGVIGIFH
jgi:hypothetical protein